MARQREVITYHGNYATVLTYPVWGKKSNTRREKYKTTSDAQKKINNQKAVEKFKQLIECNFTKDDYELQCSFNDEHLPNDYKSCLKMIQAFLRKVRNYYKKEYQQDLKYVGVIEKGVKNGRYHMHLTLNIPDRNRLADILGRLRKLWTYGHMWSFMLEFGDDGMLGMAKYMLDNRDKDKREEEARKEGKFKKWIQSRGLKKPEVKERTGYMSKKVAKDIRCGVMTQKDIERLYPGYRVTDVNSFYNDYNGGEYLKIRLYKEANNDQKNIREIRGHSKSRNT